MLGLRYFRPLQFETRVALAEVAIEHPRVSPESVARRVDAYWAGFRMRERGRARAALSLLYVWPLLPPPGAPFPLLDREGRLRFVQRRFVGPLPWWRPPAPPFVRASIRFAVQMVYMGYYSDPQTHADTGHAPPPAPSEPDGNLPPAARLVTLDPEARHLLEADVVIVGTGAAGAIIARELAERGLDVLMLGRGAHAWFNPVVAQALVMPGWLAEHQGSMGRYDHMTCIGTLVGTAPRLGNRVRAPRPLGGEFSFAPSGEELARVVDALKQAGAILFAAGATRVMPATFRYREIDDRGRLDELDELLSDPGDLSLQSAHPRAATRSAAIRAAASWTRTSGCTAAGTCSSATRVCSRRRSCTRRS